MKIVKVFNDAFHVDMTMFLAIILCFYVRIYPAYMNLDMDEKNGYYYPKRRAMNQN